MIQRIRAVAQFAASTEMWLLTLGIAATVAISRVMLPVVLLAAAFWFLRWAAYGRLSVRTPADWAIAGLVLTIPVTLYTTALPDTTLPQVYRLLLGIAIFYTIVNWAVSPRRLNLLITGLILVGLLLDLSAPLIVDWRAGLGTTFSFIPSQIYDAFRLRVSDTVHPNVLAGSLVLILTYATTLLIFGWKHLRWFQRVFVPVVVAMTAGILLLTQSRGALIALAVALMAMTILRWRRGWWLVLAAGIAGIVVLRVMGGAAILEALTTDRTIGGFDGRREIWSRALFMIRDFPLTGVGMGTYQPMAEVLYPFFIMGADVPHAHNLFLQLAVDLGIPGLIAWLAILGIVLRASWQTYRYCRAAGNEWGACLGASMLCCQIAFAVHGLTDAVTWGMVRTAVFAWVFWALAIASWRVYVPDAERSFGRAE